MMKSVLPTIACLACGWVASAATGQEAEPVPAIRVRLDHPDEQLERLLDCFKGTKAASPAAALAAWKRASREPNQLGKPLEALIAALNPNMVGELKSLHGAEVSIRFDPETGLPIWSAFLPHDDGTFAAVASALVLSGGAAEPPIEEMAVDRLANPGSALMARIEAGTLLASNRAELKSAKTRLERLAEPGKYNCGLEVVVEPGALAGSQSVTVRRIAELIRASEQTNRELARIYGSLHARLNIGRAGLLDGTILYMDQRTFPKVAVNPAWYDWTPRDRAFTIFAFGVDPSPKSWESLFALANRIEKVDPDRANVADLQLRLDLLARVSGINLQADLLGHLIGISGWVGSTDGKAIDNAALVLHLDDGDVAERLANHLKPIPGAGSKPAGEPDRPRWLGQVAGQALRVARSERAVIVSWGEGALEASLKARNDLDHSSGPIIRKLKFDETKPMAGGVIWPERIPGLGLKPATGGNEAYTVDLRSVFWKITSKDDLSLTVSFAVLDLKGIIRRFLNQLPLDPPPDH